MSRIRRYGRAKDDLLDLWTYIAQDDIAAADRMLDRIEAKLELVADRPRLGREMPELAEDLRSVTVGNYVLFYRPVPDGIALVRVLSRYVDLDHAEFDS
ncbi:type II toxin-antitoxin system RelE/ParE family toxin [Methylobacterium sp. J-076]|uniref:type II toxin-antitoxin system RelE/ParE family toxin n=1 Tax=Methylobacterium sp. J-076 TaxID=2836655 RepID=UPI001FBA0FD8|nr:type II toxin-antitoxin system RelE/ParE family toxin [Methylobacterium sp. J-076]MCJ2013228.1 type II toxin-antitoxin system RelE/ParE family toxin [Methylobacterium sp. J-076]